MCCNRVQKIEFKVFTFMWSFKEQFIKACWEGCQVSEMIPSQIQLKKKKL